MARAFTYEEINKKIAELKARWPAHSVPPWMWQQLEDLELEMENSAKEEQMYGYQKQVNLTWEDAVQKVREELKKEGFGVLTEIDVRDTLKKKLNVDFSKYVILGACNPPFAYQALKAERQIGLLMPCNVIVYENEGKTFVSAIRPTVAMNVVENEQLAGVAGDVEDKLKKVVDSV